MWNDWRADVVEEDFKKLADAEVRVLRIFPLWSDFQPLRMHYAPFGHNGSVAIAP